MQVLYTRMEVLYQILGKSGMEAIDIRGCFKGFEYLRLDGNVDDFLRDDRNDEERDNEICEEYHPPSSSIDKDLSQK